MTKKAKQCLTFCKPEDVEILVDQAPLDYGYLLVLEYENGDFLLASSRNPSRYLSTHMSREKSVGGTLPTRVGISPQLLRYEASKRSLQKRLFDYRKEGESRFAVPEDILENALDSVFALATGNNGRRKEDRP